MFRFIIFSGYLYAALFLAEQEHAVYYWDWPETSVIIRRQCIVNWALCNILWAPHVSFLSVYVVIKMFYFLPFLPIPSINVILNFQVSFEPVPRIFFLASLKRFYFETFNLKASSTLYKLYVLLENISVVNLKIWRISP